MMCTAAEAGGLPPASYDGYEHNQYTIYLEYIGDGHDHFLQPTPMQEKGVPVGMLFSLKDDYGENHRTWVFPGTQFLGYIITVENTEKGPTAVFRDLRYKEVRLRLHRWAEVTISAQQGFFTLPGATAPIQLRIGETFEVGGTTYTVDSLDTEGALLRWKTPDPYPYIQLPLSWAGKQYVESRKFKRDLFRIQEASWRSGHNELNTMFVVFGSAFGFFYLTMYGAILTGFLLRDQSPIPRPSKRKIKE
jgi:hypothetical protein